LLSPTYRNVKHRLHFGETYCILLQGRGIKMLRNVGHLDHFGTVLHPKDSYNGHKNQSEVSRQIKEDEVDGHVARMGVVIMNIKF